MHFIYLNDFTISVWSEWTSVKFQAVSSKQLARIGNANFWCEVRVPMCTELKSRELAGVGEDSYNWPHYT
jgi:hypothetical protein